MTIQNDLSPAQIARTMENMVCEAIQEIRSQLDTFKATAKPGIDGVYDDLVTTADTAAQGIYARLISRYYPDCGIIGEELNLRIFGKNAMKNVYFTVDPLDGTKAYGRRQSHGIGTMIALVVDGKVWAAYVGDVMTEEIYGFVSDSPVVRIRPNGKRVELAIDPERPLSTQYLLLRENPVLYRPVVQGMTKPKGLFKDVVVEGSSIGIGAARLWKEEVGAMALIPKKMTPWDDTPVVGISQKMGFVFYQVAYGGLIKCQPKLLEEECSGEGQQLLMIHESRKDELLRWVEDHKKEWGSITLC